MFMKRKMYLKKKHEKRSENVTNETLALYVITHLARLRLSCVVQPGDTVVVCQYF